MSTGFQPDALQSDAFQISGGGGASGTQLLAFQADAFQPAAFQILDAGLAPTTAGILVWDGGAWVEKPAKVWDGAAWLVKPVRYWNGTTWL